MSPDGDTDAARESRLRFFATAVQAGFGGRVLYKLDAHLESLESQAAFELPAVEYWLLRKTPRHEYPDGLDRLRVNSRYPLSWYRREAPETFIAEWPDDHDEYRIFGNDDESQFLAVRFESTYEETHVLPTDFSVIDVHVPTEAAVESPQELLVGGRTERRRDQRRTVGSWRASEPASGSERASELSEDPSPTASASSGDSDDDGDGRMGEDRASREDRASGGDESGANRTAGSVVDPETDIGGDRHDGGDGGEDDSNDH